MNWARKGFVHLLGLLLLTALVGGAVAVGLNQNFSNPDKLKSWLEQSKIYEHIVPAALDQSQADSTKSGGSMSISLNNAITQDAAQKAFTPEVVKNTVNTFLDANYSWLSGKTAKPQFSVDLTSTKQTFAQTVGDFVATRLKSLPVCTATQQANLQIPVDPLSVGCRPANLDPKTEGNRVAQEVSSGQFLNDPVITPTSLGQDKKQTKPYYDTFSKAPQLYSLTQKLPLIFAALALLTALGIIVAHPERRRGIRRVGVILLEAGLILIVSKLAADWLARHFEGQILTSASKNQLQKPLNDFFQLAESHLTQTNNLFGIIFLLLAAAAFIYLFTTRHGSKPKQPGFASPQPVQESFTDEESHQPAPRPAPPAGTDIKDRMRAPQPTGPPTMTPTPQKRPPKPPRLIQ